MLSRRSRIAGFLTKKSGLIRWAQKRPALALGVVGGGSAGAVTAYEDIKKGMQGLSPRYLAARRAGYKVPEIKSRYGYSSLMGSVNPTSVDQARQQRLRQWSGG